WRGNFVLFCTVAGLLVARLQVLVAPLVELVVGVSHRLRLAAAEHDLEIDRAQAVVLIAVNHAGRTRDAFPGPESRGDSLAALVLDEHIEKALEHEEALLHLVSVSGVALAGLDIHDREREVPGRDDGRIAVLA